MTVQITLLTVSFSFRMTDPGLSAKTRLHTAWPLYDQLPLVSVFESPSDHAPGKGGSHVTSSCKPG